MVCGQAGEDGAAAAELVVEEEEQENAFALTNRMVGETVKADHQNLRSAMLEAVLWMVTGTLLVCGVAAAKAVVGVRNTELGLVTSLRMEADAVLENQARVDSVIHNIVGLK